jgi:hypothetical protein
MDAEVPAFQLAPLHAHCPILLWPTIGGLVHSSIDELSSLSIPLPDSIIATPQSDRS